MMITIGNFFFRYRNILFIFLYILLFIPSPPLFKYDFRGVHYYDFSITVGLLVTILGQLIRGATIGLAYIVRGGQDKKVYAETLVVSGIFRHVRNPLYIGNILMLGGAGVLANSMIFTLVVIPLFLFIYHAIVLAEEDFLQRKFGGEYTAYTQHVNRWIPNLHGIQSTFTSMTFDWKRWLIKEYNTQFVWLSGLLLIILYKYPDVFVLTSSARIQIAAVGIYVFGIYYLTIRFLKKTGRWK